MKTLIGLIIVLLASISLSYAQISTGGGIQGQAPAVPIPNTGTSGPIVQFKTLAEGLNKVVLIGLKLVACVHMW